MNVQNFITEVAVLGAGGVITVTASWFLLRNDIRKYTGASDADRNQTDQLLGLRMQAHERMIVFVERLNPSNLFLRLYEQGMTASVLQSLILTELRSEFQHNVSQQLYLSPAAWNVIVKLKEDTIAMINNATGQLPADASGRDLSVMVLEHVSQIPQNPYELTVTLIKQDIQRLF